MAVDKILIVFLHIVWYNMRMQTDNYIDLILNKCSAQFNAFSKMLKDYNKICNITSIVDDKGIIYKHFLDSIAGEFLFGKDADVVEIGSGGGFPSIPLKIVRDDLKFTLIESTGKKCSFLNSVVDNLGLKCVQVKNIRAEVGAHDKNMREKYDIACARAVARLNVLCEYCLPFVRAGGKFIAYKGVAEEEIKEAENALKVLGGEIEQVVKYELPEDCSKRTLVCIRKIKHTPALYPRGQGRERKNPL